MKSICCLLIISFSLLFQTAFGQTDGDEKKNDKSEETGEPIHPFISDLIWGTGFGAQFGGITFIDISPMVGYPITKRFIAGLGGSYRYYRQRGATANAPSFRANILGGSVWSRFYVFDNLYAHAEYEMLRIDLFGGANQVSYLKGTALVGAGYQQRYGERVTGFMSVLFPVYTDQTQIELYRIPVIRFGILVNVPSINW